MTLHLAGVHLLESLLGEYIFICLSNLVKLVYPSINTNLIVTADTVARIIEASPVILVHFIVVVHLSPSRTLARIYLDTHLIVYSQVLRGAVVMTILRWGIYGTIRILL